MDGSRPRLTAKQLLQLLKANDIAREMDLPSDDGEVERRAAVATELMIREAEAAAIERQARSPRRGVSEDPPAAPVPGEKSLFGALRSAISGVVSAGKRLAGNVRPGGPRGSPVGAGGEGNRPDDPLAVAGYVLERHLGAGGMGTVSLIRSRVTGQRFALKTIGGGLLGDADRARAFLGELETWIDIPPYPHIVRCHFFRSVGDQIGIFLEYVEGVTMADEIAVGRLSDAAILDRAIQCGRALSAVHALGTIHQDVKPANVLVTKGDTAKLTDFGLARARSFIGSAEPTGTIGTDSVLVSRKGMTPAYCSPEQENGEKLSWRTDVWSWGLMILTMYAGEVTWRSGAVAPDALAAHLKRARRGEAREIPEGLRRGLTRCFALDPSQRWASMDEAVSALDEEYRVCTGHEYPRPAPPPVARPAGDAEPHVARRQASWNLAHRWLVTGLHERERLRARDPEEQRRLLHNLDPRHFDSAQTMAPPSRGSTRAQAIAELAGLDEARKLIESHSIWEHRVGDFFMQKGLLHERVDDIPGALRMYERAAGVYKAQVCEQRLLLAPHLADAMIRHSRMLALLGGAEPARHDYADAVWLLRRVMEEVQRPEILFALAAALVAEADHARITARAWGPTQVKQVISAYDEALVLHTDAAAAKARPVTSPFQEVRAAQIEAEAALRVPPGDKGFVYALGEAEERHRAFAAAELPGRAHLGKGAALLAAGDARAALRSFVAANHLYEGLSPRDSEVEPIAMLARTYTELSGALRQLGRAADALDACDAALAGYALLDHSEGRWCRADGAVLATLEKASVLDETGRRDAAREKAASAVAEAESLVIAEGRHHLLPSLVCAYATSVRILGRSGDHAGAAELTRRLEALRARLQARAT